MLNYNEEEENSELNKPILVGFLIFLFWRLGFVGMLKAVLMYVVGMTALSIVIGIPFLILVGIGMLQAESKEKKISFIQNLKENFE